MKKGFMRYSILVGVGMVLGIAVSSISNVFGAPAQTEPGNPSTQETILNTACIEYTTPTGTGIKCDDVTITLNSGSVQEHQYFITKRQKTGGMARYTTGQITVQSGEYIQYKVNFGSITGDCRNGTIKDILPSCVRYVSSEIYGVSGSPSFSTGNGFLQYTNFRLNGGSQGYILVTGQIMVNTANCENKTRYVNTGGFKCGNPSSNWIYSDVVAVRTGSGGGGEGSGSQVIFTKDGNKYEMHPAETGLVFTLEVENQGPETITNVVIDDIWPNPNNNGCIIYDGWTGLNWTKADGYDYKWNYVGSNGRLRSGQHAKLYLYAKIKNNSACVGSYINTGKLTYQVGGKSRVLYDDYPFIVVDGGAGSGIDVTIEKTVYPNNPSHGQSITYTITYTNIGTESLTDYTIVDYWPDDKVKFNGSDTPGYTTGYDANHSYIITWLFDGPLAPQRSKTIKLYGIVR